jgi:membrane protein
MKTFIWFWRLICRWLVEAYFDNTTGLAAMMAYDLLFILAAPGLLLLSALLSLFGTDPTLLHTIIELLQGFLPDISKPIIAKQVVALVITGSSSRVALLGIPLALYLGINLINTISRTLNHCLGIKEPQRSWWNRWIIAVLLLFWFGITILFSFNAILFGERVAAVIEETFRLHIDLQGLVTMLKYPIIAVALTILALALYLLTPEIYQTIGQALPGAIFFSVGWLVATTVFSLYVEHSRYVETYRALADVIVLLTWTWVTCLLLLLGGRLNAVIVRKWPTRPGAHHGHLLAGQPEPAPADAPGPIAAETVAGAT